MHVVYRVSSYMTHTHTHTALEMNDWCKTQFLYTTGGFQEVKNRCKKRKNSCNYTSQICLDTNNFFRAALHSRA